MAECDWREHHYFKHGHISYQENLRVFLDFFEKNSDCMLLDLGCSDGNFTKKIAEKVNTKNVYGIEINEKAAQKAKEQKIDVKIADLNGKVPFVNQQFDVISANQVIEHLWNTDNFFREINRIMKIGAYAIISTPNLSALHSIFFILLGQQTPVIQLIDMQVGNCLKGVKVESPHYKAFNIPALKDLSEYYGFQVEKIAGSGFHYIPQLFQRAMTKILTRYAIFLTIKIKKIKNFPE